MSHDVISSPVILETAEGCFQAVFSEHGLAELSLPGGRPNRIGEPGVVCNPMTLRNWIRLTKSALGRALLGKQPEQLPPLDLASGTSFQREVWQFLLAIPAGEVRTYRDVALALDRPGSSRAVGQACGANPIAVLVPCHRVIASNGALGGYSAGLTWKRRLLELENARLDKAG
jgi:O-6-methylguanine DNA methyltransferase